MRFFIFLLCITSSLFCQKLNIPYLKTTLIDSLQLDIKPSDIKDNFKCVDGNNLFATNHNNSKYFVLIINISKSGILDIQCSVGKSIKVYKLKRDSNNYCAQSNNAKQIAINTKIKVNNDDRIYCVCPLTHQTFKIKLSPIHVIKIPFIDENRKSIIANITYYKNIYGSESGGINLSNKKIIDASNLELIGSDISNVQFIAITKKDCFPYYSYNLIYHRPEEDTIVIKKMAIDSLYPIIGYLFDNNNDMLLISSMLTESMLGELFKKLKKLTFSIVVNNNSIISCKRGVSIFNHYKLAFPSQCKELIRINKSPLDHHFYIKILSK